MNESSLSQTRPGGQFVQVTLAQTDREKKEKTSGKRGRRKKTDKEKQRTRQATGTKTQRNIERVWETERRTKRNRNMHGQLWPRKG